MVDIALPQRQALPPSRTGGVKPPTELAGGSGLKQAGAMVTKFAGSTFDRLSKARVANEEAQFQGFVKTAMGEYNTYVASNPGASFDDLEKERDKMLGNIKAAGNSSTMPDAKANNANWYAMNLGSIRTQTQASMEATRVTDHAIFGVVEMGLNRRSAKTLASLVIFLAIKIDEQRFDMSVKESGIDPIVAAVPIGGLSGRTPCVSPISVVDWFSHRIRRRRPHGSTAGSHSREIGNLCGSGGVLMQPVGQEDFSRG